MFLNYSLGEILCLKIGQHSEPEVFRDLEAEVWSVMGKYCKISDMWLYYPNRASGISLKSHQEGSAALTSGQ